MGPVMVTPGYEVSGISQLSEILKSTTTYKYENEFLPWFWGFLGSALSAPEGWQQKWRGVNGCTRWTWHNFKISFKKINIMVSKYIFTKLFSFKWKWSFTMDVKVIYWRNVIWPKATHSVQTSFVSWSTDISFGDYTDILTTLSIFIFV